MKKVLLFGFALCATLSGWAQTKDAPLGLKEGDNTYVSTEGSASYDTYWKYTAEKNVMVSFLGKADAATNSNTYIYNIMGIEGTDTVRLNTAQDENYAKLLPVKAGQNLLLQASVYGGTTCIVNFSANDSVPGIGTGLTAEEPLVLANGQKQIVGDPKETGTDSVYASYTATEDGVLVITVLKGSPQGGKINGTTPCTWTYEYAAGGYQTKLEVKAGETYSIEWSSYGITLLTSELTHPIAGTREWPFTITEGVKNYVPAEKGVYYYTLVCEKPGFANITSTDSVPGTFLKAYAGINSLNYDMAEATSESGSYNVRFEMEYASVIHYIVVTRAEDADKCDSILYTYEDYKLGEKESNPIVIETVPTTEDLVVPATSNYYYSLTVPADQTGFLVAEATSNVASAMTSLKVYPQGNSWSGTAGNTVSKYAVSADNTNYTILVCNAETADLTFKVYYETIKDGDLITQPLTAVLGENTIDANGTRYYQYTTTKDCKLVLTATPNMTVSFPQGTSSWAGEEQNFVSGVKNMIIAEADKNYLITIEGALNGDVFTLEEIDFEAGDTRNTAIAVENDTITFGDQAPVNVWYKWTAPKDGVAEIASDLEYSYENNNYTVYYVKNDNPYPDQMVQMDENYNPYFAGSTEVNEGDSIFVNVQFGMPVTGKTISFSVREATPGEMPASAVEMVVDSVYTIPAQGYSGKYWVKAYLKADTVSFKLSNTGGIRYFIGLENANDDMSEGYLFPENYDDQGNTLDYFKADLVVATEGEYYFQFSYNYDDIELSFTSKALATAINDINAAENGEKGILIYNLSGALMPNKTTNGLKKGLYVIKNNGKVSKVMVK